jgi:four helix bundle protein
LAKGVPQHGGMNAAASRADKLEARLLAVVLKELNETVIWLELIARSSLRPAEELVAITAENRELCRIITASIKTARGSSDR